MTTTVEAIYQDGKLILPRALPLAEKSHVLVTIESTGENDAERAAWLGQSERVLMQTWDNPDDDVFNELLTK
ncbi:MAG: antitoxin family protein [Verrucomicrobiota bacterium]|nr:antitoxin family protein [Verrucomicrobiota bacterium]